MAERYDAIVIGAGVAGEVCAEDLVAGGMKVAICERELVAGECGYWACIPSKTMLRPGEVLSEARQAPGAREAISGPINVKEALAWRNFQVSDWDDSHPAGKLTEAGVELRRGDARISAPGEIEIDGKLLETERLIIATGSDPVIPPIDGLDELDDVWTNREATSLTEIPQRLVVLGGGPVGVELGQALSRLGASVAIAEGEDRLLPGEAPALGEALHEALPAEGIELRLGVKASAAERRGEGYSLSFEDGSELRGEQLLVATGRQPRVHGFGLDAAGIDPDGAAKGIEVDERMRAGDGVWAIGDVTGIWPFTHVGKYQGRVAAADILGRDVTADYRAVPRVVFTDPQIAAVGEQDGSASGTVRASVDLSDLDLFARVRQAPWIPHRRLRRREADRGPRRGTGGGGVAPAGHPGDQGRGADRGAAPDDPALSDLLRGVLLRAQGSLGRRSSTVRDTAASMNPEITAENIKQWLPGTFPGDMAIEPVEITDEVATGRMVVDKRHLHPGGFVHGGVWTAFGDSVAAWATFRALPPNHDFTTIELKLNVFAAGVLGDEMICEARPLHVGRSTAVIEAKIRKGHIDGFLLASLGGPSILANLIVTQFVLPGRDPRAERPAPGDYPPGD